MSAKNTQTTTSLGTDVLAVVCSVGCAIHCAATPILLAVLPSVAGLRWLANPVVHQAVAIVCAVLVLRAIVPGWVKHRSQMVASFAAVGLTLLVLSAFVLPDGCCLTQPAAVSDVNLQTLGTMQPAGIVDWNPPLVSELNLVSIFGSRIATQIIDAQPLLTPIGGIFLILAHILNISLTTGAKRAARCAKSACLH